MADFFQPSTHITQYEFNKLLSPEGKYTFKGQQMLKLEISPAMKRKMAMLNTVQPKGTVKDRYRNIRSALFNEEIDKSPKKVTRKLKKRSKTAGLVKRGRIKLYPRSKSDKVVLYQNALQVDFGAKLPAETFEIDELSFGQTGNQKIEEGNEQEQAQRLKELEEKEEMKNNEQAIPSSEESRLSSSIHKFEIGLDIVPLRQPKPHESRSSDSDQAIVQVGAASESHGSSSSSDDSSSIENLNTGGFGNIMLKNLEGSNLQITETNEKDQDRILIEKANAFQQKQNSNLTGFLQPPKAKIIEEPKTVISFIYQIRTISPQNGQQHEEKHRIRVCLEKNEQVKKEKIIERMKEDWIGQIESIASLKIKCKDGVYEEFDQAVGEGHQIKSGDEMLLFVLNSKVDDQSDQQLLLVVSKLEKKVGGIAEQQKLDKIIILQDNQKLQQLQMELDNQKLANKIANDHITQLQDEIQDIKAGYKFILEKQSGQQQQLDLSVADLSRVSSHHHNQDSFQQPALFSGDTFQQNNLMGNSLLRINFSAEPLKMSKAVSYQGFGGPQADTNMSRKGTTSTKLGAVEDKNKRHEVSRKRQIEDTVVKAKAVDPNKVLDMAFLYADPIVRQEIDGKLYAVETPLELDAEYQHIIDNLKTTGKQFSILKEAVNFESLQNIISKAPKIIHISCHGAYDTKMKEFYLALEDIDNGLEDRFSQARLAELLKASNSSGQEIKVAFVSACQSEEMGEIFFKSGIPIVIAVNSDQEIMDDCCKLFSRQFYTNLLRGQSIGNAFEQAKRTIRVSTGDYDTCCCAHKHSSDCMWYKFYQQDQKAAHDLHNQTCHCNQHGVNGRREHTKDCKSYIEFVNFLKDFKKEQDQKENNQASAPAEQDLWAVDDDFEDMMDNDVIGLDPNAKLIMCCCHKDTPHDETMKFTMKVNPEYMKTRDNQILECTLFAQREDGQLYQWENRTGNRSQIPSLIDRKLITGRHNEIHEIIKFLTQRSTNQKIFQINGKEGLGCSQIAKFAIKYVMERHHFDDGAYHINVSNKYSIQGLVSTIGKNLQFWTNDQAEIIDLIRRKKLVLLINHCDKIIQKDQDNFLEFLKDLAEQTEFVKIILITHAFGDTLTQKHPQVKAMTKLMTVQPLSKNEAVKMLFMLNRDNSDFQYKDTKALSIHQIFSDFQFTPGQITQICVLLQTGQSLDQIHQSQLALRSKEQRTENERADLQIEEQMINEQVYKRILDAYPQEIKVIHALSFAPSGLSEYDIYRIILLLNAKETDKISYGQWTHFLGCNIPRVEGNVLSGDDGLQSEDDGVVSCRRVHNIDYEVVHIEQMSEIQQERFFLKGSLQLFIRNLLLSTQTQGNICLDYLKYMSILSRQILRSIKCYQFLDFNPYMVSSQIEQGLWREPDQLKYEMNFRGENKVYSKNQPIYNPIQQFSMHEGNFEELLDNEKLKQMFGQSVFEEPMQGELEAHLDEICINIPSILIMLQKYKEAEALFEKVMMIGSDHRCSITMAKIKLISVSLRLEINDFESFSIQNDLVEADEIFADQGLQLGNGETCFLNAVYHIRQVEKLIKQKFTQGQVAERRCSIQEEEDQPDASGPRNSTGAGDFFRGDTFDPMQFEACGRPTSASVALDRSALARRISAGTYAPVVSGSQNLERKIVSQYDSAIEKLAKSRKHFDKCMLGVSKTWLVQAELMVEKTRQIEEIQDQIELQDQLIELDDNLTKASEYFRNQDCDVLYTQCLIMQAQIQYQLNNFIVSRDQAIKCLSNAKDLQLLDLQIKANHLFQQCSLKIQIELNNVFIFATALPIKLADGELSQPLYTRTSDFSELLMDELSKTKKQLNLKFEVLNERFLNQFRKFGSKVLHLSPKLFDPENNNGQILMEDDDFKGVKLTPLQLKKILQPEEGKLTANLVFIELPNCQDFSKVFQELGVPHVISFTINSQRIGISNLAEDHQISEFSKMNHIADYMKEFSINFYQQVVQNQSIFKAAQTSERLTDFKFQGRQQFSIQCHHLIMQGNEKDKLFDNERLDERKRINDGELYDISPIRANSNFVLNTSPFFARTYFNHLSSLVTRLTYQQDPVDSKQQACQINVFGAPGIGKSRLVQEIAEYLQYRYLFKEGVYFIDLAEQNSFDEVNEIIQNLKVSSATKIANHAEKAALKSTVTQQFERSLQRPSGESKGQQEEQMLLIMDNCDNIMQSNRMSFEGNLKHLKNNIRNVSLVFISRTRFDPELNFLPFQVKPLSFSESLQYLQCINDSDNQVQLKSLLLQSSDNNAQFLDLVSQAQGSISILELICSIAKYCGKDVLNKIKILPLNKMRKLDPSKTAKFNRGSSQSVWNDNKSQFNQTITSPAHSAFSSKKLSLSFAKSNQRSEHRSQILSHGQKGSPKQMKHIFSQHLLKRTRTLGKSMLSSPMKSQLSLSESSSEGSGSGSGSSRGQRADGIAEPPRFQQIINQSPRSSRSNEIWGFTRQRSFTTRRNEQRSSSSSSQVEKEEQQRSGAFTKNPQLLEMIDETLKESARNEDDFVSVDNVENTTPKSAITSNQNPDNEEFPNPYSSGGNMFNQSITQKARNQSFMYKSNFKGTGLEDIEEMNEEYWQQQPLEELTIHKMVSATTPQGSIEAKEPQNTFQYQSLYVEARQNRQHYKIVIVEQLGSLPQIDLYMATSQPAPTPGDQFRTQNLQKARTKSMLVTQQQRGTNLAVMLAYSQKKEEESSILTRTGVRWVKVSDLRSLSEFIIYADLEAISKSQDPIDTDKSLGTLSSYTPPRNQSENDRLSEVEPGEEREDLE